MHIGTKFDVLKKLLMELVKPTNRNHFQEWM